AVPGRRGRLRVLRRGARARAQPLRHVGRDSSSAQARGLADPLGAEPVPFQRARVELVPDSQPPGEYLRLDPPNHDEARRDERLPPPAVRRPVPPSAHPDLRAARPLHRLPVRQDLNLACLTHAYPRWEGDVAGAFVERLVLALKARGHGVHVVAPADAGKGGKELRHQVPVTRVRYAPARGETPPSRGPMVAP